MNGPLPVYHILILQFHTNIVSIFWMSNQEKDSISGSWLELELDDKLLLKIGKVGSVNGHVALPVKADTTFRPLLQFVPKI